MNVNDKIWTFVVFGLKCLPDTVTYTPFCFGQCLGNGLRQDICESQVLVQYQTSSFQKHKNTKWCLAKAQSKLDKIYWENSIEKRCTSHFFHENQQQVSTNSWAGISWLNMVAMNQVAYICTVQNKSSWHLNLCNHNIPQAYLKLPVVKQNHSHFFLCKDPFIRASVYKELQGIIWIWVIQIKVIVYSFLSSHRCHWLLEQNPCHWLLEQNIVKAVIFLSSFHDF